MIVRVIRITSVVNITSTSISVVITGFIASSYSPSGMQREMGGAPCFSVFVHDVSFLCSFMNLFVFQKWKVLLGIRLLGTTFCYCGL